MGLKILISSAIRLKQKEIVKESLNEIKESGITIDWVYDCAEHSTMLGLSSKQQLIDREEISRSDWFICLMPEKTVGINTWKELETALGYLKNGEPIVISIFHPLTFLEGTGTEELTEGKMSFEEVRKKTGEILGNQAEQYWVSYEYGNEEDFRNNFKEEFRKLYYSDRVFRDLHLNGLSAKGRDIKAKSVYFDENRADIINGFIEDKYFARESVDGRIQNALEENRQIIVLQGTPGSGKTRALYQLMVDYEKNDTGGYSLYALGSLADKRVIVINRDNVFDVLRFMREEENLQRQGIPLSEYYLFCDQLKDVFGMVTRDEELFDFFERLTHYDHVRLLATSTPSAFKQFKERWNEYGRQPFDDKVVTELITIPPISADVQQAEIRNWIKDSLPGSVSAESIGDHIVSLNRYKEAIVESLYGKVHEYRYLPHFLKAVQIITTFRKDTALFLPLILMRCNLEGGGAEPIARNEFVKETVRMLNFLISKNVIWVRHLPHGKESDPRIVKVFTEDTFSLEFGLDDDEDFTFDGEVYPQTLIPTSYAFGVNEIVWEHLRKEDANRHYAHRKTLLPDYNSKEGILRAAKEFYRAFRSVVSLRRILPRVPYTEVFYEARTEVWKFIRKEFGKIEPQNTEREEFLLLASLLIGRAQTFEDILEVEKIIEERGMKPNYIVVGELYTWGQRLNGEAKVRMADHIDKLRCENGLDHQDFFSLSREITFLDLDFSEAIERIRTATYQLDNYGGKVLNLIEASSSMADDSLQRNNLRRLLETSADKADTPEKWLEIFETYCQLGLTVRRTLIWSFFSNVREYGLRLYNTAPESVADRSVINEFLTVITEKFPTVISREDEESVYFAAVENSHNFKEALPVYDKYLKKYGTDNPRLVSVLFSCAMYNEYQALLGFMNNLEKRMAASGRKPSHILYNNLLKATPSSSEALNLVKRLPLVQEYTLAIILRGMALKRKIIDWDTKSGTKKDPMNFFYAYSAVNRPEFKNVRHSPYVVRLLYELTTTPKQERYIREKFLAGIPEVKKKEFIDYSPTVTNTRLFKNYRNLDEVWEIFNTFRNHWREKELFVPSDAYCGMIGKIQFLAETPEILERNRERLRRIILREDWDRILKDGYFICNVYRFFKEEKIFDSDGEVGREFQLELAKSNLKAVKPLNSTLLHIVKSGADYVKVKKFYDFIEDFYVRNNKWETLRPDLRTATLLIQSVETREQMESAYREALRWVPAETLLSNKIFIEKYNEKREGFGLETMTRDSGTRLKKAKLKEDRSRLTFMERSNRVIESIRKEIYLYNSLTALSFNRYLKELRELVDDIRFRFKDDIPKINSLRGGLYYHCLKENILEPYSDLIEMDGLSYVYLLQLIPAKEAAKEWIDRLRTEEEVLKYDFVVCSAVAQSDDLCKADIDTGLDFFYHWEDIMYDIGYDPSDPESFSDESKKWEGNGFTDYDGFWATRNLHSYREMAHYWRRINETPRFVDYTALQFIKNQMELFEDFGVPFPPFKRNGKYLDFKKEIDNHPEAFE